MAAPPMVVVTGANGFIGRAVCAHLRGMGWPVRGLVRTLDGGTAARAEFMAVGDLATIDDHALRNALRGATAVVHLAARVHQPADAKGDALAAMRRINVDVTERLARAAAAAGVTHFVFASSVKVNGEATMPGRPFCESDPPDPHDDYAATKWEAEQALADGGRGNRHARDRAAPAADLRTRSEGQSSRRSRARFAPACRCRSRASATGAASLASAIAAPRSTCSCAAMTPSVTAG